MVYFFFKAGKTQLEFQLLRLTALQSIFCWMCVCVLSCFSHVRLCATLWTVARQGPLSMGFSLQEFWSGLPFPSSEDLPEPGIKPVSLKSHALAGGFFTTSTIQEAHILRNSLAKWSVCFSCSMGRHFPMLKFRTCSSRVSRSWRKGRSSSLCSLLV